MISIDYLDLDKNKIAYAKYKNGYYVNTGALIKDI